MTGGQITHVFRVTRRGRPRESRPPAARLLLEAIPTQPECRACQEWGQPLDGGHVRCSHPARGCPRCETRIDPWEHPRPCPLKTTPPFPSK